MNKISCKVLRIKVHIKKMYDNIKNEECVSDNRKLLCFGEESECRQQEKSIIWNSPFCILI